MRHNEHKLHPSEAGDLAVECNYACARCNYACAQCNYACAQCRQEMSKSDFCSISIQPQLGGVQVRFEVPQRQIKSSIPQFAV